MSELKPCPWCGSQPFRMNANEDGGDPYYACPTFLCPGDQKCHNCGEQEGWMAEKWNRRASPPSGVDVDAVVRSVPAVEGEAPSSSPEVAEQLIEAAKRIDWVQIAPNGRGCFHLEEDGRFCLRTHHWAGHGGDKPTHLYEPLYVAMTRIAKAADTSPALAALVEAGDAMRNAGHLLRTSCYQVQVTPEARMWDDALAAWDRARAAIKEKA